jgi:hypothetical protein
MVGIGPAQRTFTLFAMTINASACNQHIVDNGETAFAADPAAVTRPDTGIVQDGCFVEEDAARVDEAGEWNLLGVEKVKA